MDTYPLCRQGSACGELTAERESLYTRFTARCPLPPEGLWCVWLVGEQGEMRLGVPEPQGGEAIICRRFSDRMTAPLGRILRGELRPVERKAEWRPLTAGVFHSPFLCRRLQGAGGVLVRMAEKYRLLALPYAQEKPFPLTALFCFACIRQIGGRDYAVFAFDESECPVFLELEKF